MGVIMRKSINTKLFLLLALLVIIVISIVWLLNTTVLQSYYVYTKKKDMARLFKEINSIYSEYTDDINISSIENELEKIDSRKNIDIVVQNNEEMTVYSTTKDFARNPFSAREPLPSFSFDSKELEFTTVPYIIQVMNDNKINSDFIFLMRQFR